MLFERKVLMVEDNEINRAALCAILSSQYTVLEAENGEQALSLLEKYREGIIGNIPAGRFGEPEEVADLAEFLVSDKAKYINGQTIHINGGSYL